MFLLLEIPERALRKDLIKHLERLGLRFVLRDHLDLLVFLGHLGLLVQREAGRRLDSRGPLRSTQRAAKDHRVSCAGSEHTVEVQLDGAGEGGLVDSSIANNGDGLSRG